MRSLGLLSICLIWTGCTESTPPPSEPDAIFQTYVTATAENKPELFLTSLPRSYQNDVTALLRQFAGKIDPEIWDRGMEVAKKLVRVLRDQKDYILGNPMLQQFEIPRKQIGEQWENLVKAVTLLFESEIKTHQGLSNVDPAKFLAGTGAQLMEKASEVAAMVMGEDYTKQLDNLQNAKTTVVHQDGDRATIRVDTAGEAPEQIAMVRVEGQWIPKQFADQWKSKISEARSWIEHFQMDTGTRLKALLTLGTADSTLDQLLAARSQAEFDQTVQGVLAVLGPFLGG